MTLRSMRFQTVFCFTLCCLLFCQFNLWRGPAFGAQLRVAQDDSDVRSVKVYRLEFVAARDAERIVGGLANELTDARIVADQRVNSLIVVAQAQGHQIIEDLIATIDVKKREQVAANPPGELATISLGGIDSDLVRRVLNSQLEGRPGVRMEVIDDMVIISGDESAVARVRALVGKLADSNRTEVGLSSVYLSMTFVVEGQQIEEGDARLFRKPDSKIVSVISQSVDAGLLAMKNPMVVSKTVNRVRVNHDGPIRNQKQGGIGPAFVNRSESGGKGFAMSNSGYIAQLSGETFQIDANILLTVNSQLKSQLQGSSELNATLEVPLNHPVLLSFSTILGIDSAVILEIQEAK